MRQVAGERFRQEIALRDPSSPRFSVELVELILSEARAAGASDVHLQPTAEGLAMRWRIDGVLHEAGLIPREVAPNVVARLKVLAELLTYRTDVPQEGRIRGEAGDLEMRLSTFPTIHGEKAVVRLFAASGSLARLDDLGLPAEILRVLRRLLGETSGAVLFSGPAGSG